MKILVNINRNEAIRLGVDAPMSPYELDIHPADLTQIEREVLATILVNGHDATHLGLKTATETAAFKRQEYSETGSKITTYSNGHPTSPLVLYSPDLAGFKEAVQRLLNQYTEERNRFLSVLRAKQADARNQLNQVMSADPEITPVYWRADGTVTGYKDSGCILQTTYPKINTYVSQLHNLSAEDKGVYQAWEQQANDKNTKAKEAAIEAAQPALARKLAELKDQEAAEAKAKADAEAKAKAEREEMIARLPEVFQSRIAAGYADAEEVDKAIRCMARADAGLVYEKYRVSRDLNTLTDEEFVVLKATQEKFAKTIPDATVTPKEVADEGGFGGYREAEYSDDPEDVDDDGDVWEDGDNVRRRMMVSWDVAGVTVRTILPFDMPQ